VKRVRQRIRLLRDDHLGDSLGAIFLDASPEKHDAIIERLREYLGVRVRILKAEIATDCIEVEAEVRALPEESRRLAAAADDLRRKGAPRNAAALFHEALELDPLGREASLGLGLLLAGMERFDEALVMLKRAREAGPDDVELLYALGSVCLRLERTASAISYLERAFELHPRHFGVRRALIELGRRPQVPPRARSENPRPAKPSREQL
jgi:tetratricopeptide (TPR) repeat protein